MPKKDDSDSFITSEYGTWNVASDYSRLKIMKPLYLADEYETIATFGYVEFSDEIFNVSSDVLKVRGFKRLIKTLILIINNSKFAVKGTFKEELNKYKKELERYYKVVSTLCKYKVDDRKKTKELTIIPEKYDPALERVIEIKSLINEPLNRYDLIFTHREEFDVKEFKKKFMEEAKQRG